MDRLWDAAGLPALLANVAPQASVTFPLERSLYLAVLQILFGPDHLTVDAAHAQQVARAVFWADRHQQEVEDRLATHHGGNVGTGDAFLDMLPVYLPGLIEGGDGTNLAVFRAADGRPFACRAVRGTNADADRLDAVAGTFCQRFRRKGACLVSTWGVPDVADVRRLGRTGLSYITGGALRTRPREWDRPLPQASRFPKVAEGVRAKEFAADGRRCVLFHDVRQGERDATAREALVQAVQDELREGDPTIPPDDIDDRFLKGGRHGVEIDRAKVNADARYDGLFLLESNTALTVPELISQLGHLRQEEEILAAALAGRGPGQAFYFRDRFLRGHVSCGFLALLLVQQLRKRLADQGQPQEWRQIRDGVRALAEVELNAGGKRYLVRPAAEGDIGQVLRALGIETGPLLKELSPHGDSGAVAETATEPQ
jgi:hypothetical protein